MSDEITDRNKKIYEDKKTMSFTELIRKYGLSLATLQNIVMRERMRELQETVERYQQQQKKNQS